MQLNKVSDNQIREEYQRRFTLKRGERIDGSEAAARHFQTLLISNAKQEQFLVIFLSGNNEVISCEIMFHGSLTSSAVHPRILVCKALELNSAALVLGHNHPSGNLNPSKEDIHITERLKRAVELVEMTIHDHIIIGYGKQDYYSFADHGIL